VDSRQGTEHGRPCSPAARLLGRREPGAAQRRPRRCWIELIDPPQDGFEVAPLAQALADPEIEVVLQLSRLRLGYAQHLYCQQGATVQRAVVVTGGWQTSKEGAYVQASMSRARTSAARGRTRSGSVVSRS
jgi:hypothetical protein